MPGGGARAWAAGAAACLLAAAPRAWGLATTMGPGGLGAGALGAGGAVVAVAQGAADMGWNPAARLDGGWDLDYNGALGGPAADLDEGLGLAGPLGDGLRGGLLVGDDLYPRAGGYHEDAVGVDLAADLGRYVSVGTQQRAQWAVPGGPAGWGMDVGALGRVPLPRGWGVDLGLAATDLDSQMAAPGGYAGQQPSVLRAGLALDLGGDSWVAVEQDQEQGPPAGGFSQWRVGAQASAWKGRLLLRLGATRPQGGVLYATAGAGVRFGRVRGLECDYAAMLPVGAAAGAPAAPRHALSLDWRFGGGVRAPRRAAAVPWRLAPRRARTRAPGAALSRSLVGPDGRLRWARIVFGPSRPGVRSWTLRLVDRRGVAVRVFRGLGALPRGLDFDGTGPDGAPIDPAGLRFALRVTEESGRVLRSGALLRPVAETGLGLDGGEGDSFALRGVAPSTVRPVLVLRGGPALALSGAAFDLAAVPGAAEATAWELRIVDAQGRVVRVLKGIGRPPKSVRWDGNDDFGRPADAGLGDGFELRLTDAAGASRLAAAGPLATQAAFSRAYRRLRRAAPAEGAGATPGRAPAVGAAAGAVVFTFAPGSAELDPADLKLARLAVLGARRRGARAVAITGYARDEGPPAEELTLSQARADAVLKALLGLGLDADRVTATGLGAAAGRGRVALLRF